MAARDIVLVAVLIFTFAIGFFVVHSIMSTVVDEMVAIETINESADTVTALRGIDDVLARYDYVVFGLFIGLVMGIIITGWFVAGNPIFMFIYFIVIVIGIILSTVLSNVWETTTGLAVFGATLTAFPIANNLITKMPIYLAVIGFIGIIVMFAKPQIQERF